MRAESVLFITLCAGWIALPLQAQAGERPNVVLVIADDQGYGDLSCHGNPVLKTPNMDRLYQESIRLTDYHVASMCSPTRSALQTGHWSNRTGVWDTTRGRSLLREDEATIGSVFRNAGYATGMFGKWHLGNNYPYRPEDRGYDEVMRHGDGVIGSVADFWDNAYFDGTYFHNSRPEAVKGYCTDVWFDYAARFILEQKKAGKPFFAFISTNAPHEPLHSPKSFSEPYRDLGATRANFFGMIANIDENLGRLRTLLEREGLANNTIFIFTSDNGTEHGETVFNAGMRGKKRSVYDGGHRVPFFVYWPNGGLAGGHDVETITAHVDVLPTLIDLCGIPHPKDVTFDGRTVRPLLEGKASLEDGSWPDRILVTDLQRVKHPIKWRRSTVMTDRWRLINGKELYDIQADPGQTSNIAAELPEVVRRLRDFYDGWWAELEPTFLRDCPIYLGHEAENPARLTSQDWLFTHSPSLPIPWNQAYVRDGITKRNGYWLVKVVEDGEYEIRLRRWPEESGAALDAGMEPGADVPGKIAWRARPGRALPIIKASVAIGDQKAESVVKPGDKDAVFRMKLKAGTTTLNASFVTSKGEVLCAYYVSVRKL